MASVTVSVDGPVIIEADDGTQSWWVNGKRHRLDGPVRSFVHMARKNGIRTGSITVLMALLILVQMVIKHGIRMASFTVLMVLRLLVQMARNYGIRMTSVTVLMALL